MNTSSLRVILALSISTVALLAAAHTIRGQGALAPGAGPGPTMKTLDQIDAKLEKRTLINAENTPGDSNTHFIISAPGSYYLGASINGENKTAIAIIASNVELDLNGFTLDGGAGSGSGITVGGSRDTITIRNGIARGWVGPGFALGNTVRCTLKGLRSIGNHSGIQVGASSNLDDCVASGNTTFGIQAGSSAIVKSCIADTNGDTGIAVGSGSRVTDSAAIGNTGGHGIQAFEGVVSHCTVQGHTTAAASSFGIFMSSRGIVADCLVSGSQSSAPSTATTGGGISAGQGSVVRDCTVNLNEGDGIVVSSEAIVIGNNSRLNGFNGNAAAIHATGASNRIEGNNALDSDRGIHVESSGNLILKNSASGNATNYAIVANNRFGPIISILPTASPTPAAVNGDSAPDSSGTTHPWANFSY